VHAAALYSYRRIDGASMAAVNVDGTRNVLAVAARTGVARVVVTSSCAPCGPVAGRCADEADGPPTWELDVPYKRSKLAAERLALARAGAGQDVVVVNPTTTVGAEDRRPTPSGRIVRDVLRRRIRGYTPTGGLNLVAAADVARGHVLALARGRAGQRYLLGGENVSMRGLFEQIAELGGVSIPRIAVPYRFALGAAWALDVGSRAVGREPALMALDEVRLARLPMYFDSGKAERELGYVHAPASEALVPAVGWFAREDALTPTRMRAGGRTARFA
ncbi:MAG: NAD-dependent epimerase/dehydratase family protein, partial [Acidimicrobiales bacterium]